MMKILKLNLIFLIFLNGCVCNSGNSGSGSTNHPDIPAIHYSLVKSYPHDTSAFTEGFMFYNGKLFESTGATSELPQTRSLFGIVDLTTGKIDTKVEIDRSKYFGEGISIMNGKIFQLTYKNKIGFIYNASDYKRIDEFNIPSEEAWGMTNDGSYLIMSDGTNNLTFLDANTLKVFKTIPVSKNGNAEEYLNELEYINGYIYANLWTTNKIAKINPQDGKIVAELDLENLANEAKSIYDGSLEMNGIAYDPASGNVFITGKLWPKIYEIKLNE
jgi:glutaminyl-peptide cyclotransferase